MLELDERDQLLVANPFADGSAKSSLSYDTVNNRILDPAVVHPLRIRSTSPPCRSDRTSVLESRSETRAHLGGSCHEVVEEATGKAASDHILVHPVGPNDSFASVALRYGVSIAALRRANQLWPSDPIHLRTELLIPRGDTFASRHRAASTRHARSVTTLGSSVEYPSGSATAAITSSFVAARNVIFSVLPARLSLDSLSSKASTRSEDHELEDFLSTRALLDADPLFADQGHELAVFTMPRSPARSKRPSVVPPPQVSVPSPVSDGRSWSLPWARTASRERLARLQPFATLPVRTSQPEPQPAMELPVRHPAFIGRNPWKG